MMPRPLSFSFFSFSLSHLILSYLILFYLILSYLIITSSRLETSTNELSRQELLRSRGYMPQLKQNYKFAGLPWASHNDVTTTSKCFHEIWVSIIANRNLLLVSDFWRVLTKNSSRVLTGLQLWPRGIRQNGGSLNPVLFLKCPNKVRKNWKDVSLYSKSVSKILKNERLETKTCNSKIDLLLITKT